MCFRTHFFSTGLQLLALLFQNSLTAEFDFVALKRKNLHQNLVAFVQLIAHVLDAAFRNLADVQQSVSTREDFDKRAEIRDTHNFAR